MEVEISSNHSRKGTKKPLEDAWQIKFQELKKYLVVNGHIRTKKGHPLGTWMTKQRNFFIKENYPKRKLNYLKVLKVGFGNLDREIQIGMKVVYLKN